MTLNRAEYLQATILWTLVRQILTPLVSLLQGEVLTFLIIRWFLVGVLHLTTYHRPCSLPFGTLVVCGRSQQSTIVSPYSAVLGVPACRLLPFWDEGLLLLRLWLWPRVTKAAHEALVIRTVPCIRGEDVICAW